jgi:hypothetical protein
MNKKNNKKNYNDNPHYKLEVIELTMSYKIVIPLTIILYNNSPPMILV